VPLTHRYTALIAGYTGAVGGALARELAGRSEWTVYGLARHPAAAGLPGLPGVTGVAADMADRDGLRRVLAPLDDVTHLFYCGRATHAEQVIEELKESLDHELDGDVDAELRRSIKKILEFNTKGGAIDFVSPPAEQVDADNDGDKVVDEEMIAEIRQAIEAARQAQEEVKLLTSQVDASD
jgi:NAD(P)-dependent dehydrogenase (short-subunit alcohol dehydrogenase family)